MQVLRYKATSSPLSLIAGAWLVLLLLAVGACSAETSEEGPPRCPGDEAWNPIESQCQPVDDDDDDVGVGDVGSGDVDSGDVSGAFDVGDGDDLDVAEDTGDVAAPPEDIVDEGDVPCEGPECEPDVCEITSISGRVTIPAGTLPLPDVAVFIPTGPLEPIQDGVSCQRCDTSSVPMVHTTTDINGEFQLMNVPSGEEFPLVIQVGKWRRTLTVPAVEPCGDTPITDEDLTRLPRNRFEGDMPKIAVATGGFDALECLVRKIGIDASDITTNAGEGRVHLFAGRGGTNRFVDTVHDGASFPLAREWWEELESLRPYDIIMYSCEGSNNPNDKHPSSRQALLEYTEEGGRVFLSHLHNIWLKDGPSDFQDVAEWGSGFGGNSGTAYFDTTFPKGQMLNDWMFSTGTVPEGEMPINDIRRTIESLDTDLAQSWIHLQESPDRTQYFSFNSPVHAEPEAQCGRLVFSDIHVAAGDTSSPSRPFPDGCTSTEFTAQEKALVFMFFDLSRCIIPDK